MSVQSIERVKDTIRKMLNLAADGSGAAEGEIANAVRFAQKLMQQHHLSENDIPIDDNDVNAQAAEAERVYADEAFTEASAYADGLQKVTWEGSLAMFVQNFIGSVRVYSSEVELIRVNGIVKLDAKGQPIKRFAYKFYGLIDDVYLAGELYSTSHLLIAGLARLKYGTVLRGEGRAYADGFVAGLHFKLKQEKERQKLLLTAPTSDRHELVVLQRSNAIAVNRATQAHNWLVRTKGIRLGKASAGSTKSHSAAYADGQRDSASYSPTANRNKRLK